jgi:hypothetical protein
VITFGRDDEDPRHMPPDRRLRIDPQRDRARLSVLAEVSLLLASSDDYVTILQSLTAMAVPTLGDWCSVHMVGSTGQLERIAIRHVDPARLEMAELLAKNAGRSNTGGRGAIDDDPNARGAARVFASGKSEWADR